MACLMVGFAGVVTSCDEDDNYDTNQIKGGVSLTAAQLQVTRGGYMQFKGSGLSQIETIIFPENVSVTDIEEVDKNTIRCIVPEEAEPGKVKLVYAGGSKALETKDIAFTEPIAVTEFAPATVKPGDELTIKGTYLNYIHTVVFATGDEVEVENAARNEIKVKVPIDASTGKFTVAYTTIEVIEANGKVTGRDTILNEIPSATALEVVAPKIAKISAEQIKSGETLVIEGSQLNQIAVIRFEGASDIVVTPAKDIFAEITKLSVEVPAAAKDGEVTLVSYAGLEYKTPAIKVVVPEVTISGDAKSYGVGDKVVLAGKNLDLIAKAAFDGTDPVAVKLVDGKIELTVVAAAKSGDITLTLLNGNTVAVKGFVTTKPEATLPTDEITPLAKISIPSTLSSRVAGVTFTTANGEETAEATATATEVKVQVPLAAVSGKVSFVMDNGEVVEIGEIKIGGYKFCAITEFSAEDVTAGNFYSANVVNAEALTGVSVGGTPVQYIVRDGIIYILTEVSMAGDQQLVLTSDVDGENVDVRYNINLLAAGKVETTIWTGDVNFTDEKWGVSFTDLQWGKYDWDFLQAGYEITIYYVANEEAKKAGYTNVRIGNGSWKSCPSLIPIANDDKKEGNLSLSLEETSFTFTLTEEDVEDLKKNGGLGVFGFGINLLKLTYTVDYSAPTAIWEGALIFDDENWGVAMTEMQWGNWDKYKSYFQTGTTVYVYFDIVGGYTNVRFGNGSWKSVPSLIPIAADEKGEGNFSFPEGTSSFSFTLTEEDANDLQSNGGLGVFGYGIKLTKIAVK